MAGNAREPGITTAQQPKVRLVSLDTYRGIVMLMLAFTVPNWDWQTPIVEANPGAEWLHSLLLQTEHATWRGITLWDMIQPSFMFMVGVSMAYSYSSRKKRGDSFTQLFRHAMVRALLLILLGVFLRSLGYESTNWTLEDVVTQIGLGYVPLFLLWHGGKRPQLIACGLLLTLCWLLFAAWPLVDESYDWQSNQAVEHLSGFWAHWNQNANPGHFLDQWLLNLFPRSEQFVANPEGYNTFNFLPSLALMIVGVLAGEKLRCVATLNHKLIWLISRGLGMVVLGILLDVVGICPLVKKVWTSSFSLVSSGGCLLILGTLFAIMDIAGWKKWAYPAVIVGMNPLAMYCMTWIVAAWVLEVLTTHLGDSFFRVFGQPYAPLMGNLATGTVLWLICWWMHRKEIYLRL